MFTAKEYIAEVTHSADFLKRKMHGFNPQVALTLGSGLGVLAEQIDVVGTLQYKDVPYFRATTVEGHKGELIWGYLSGVPIIGLAGRTHYYELAGEPDAMRRVTFAVQVMASLGVKIYFATNAVGGLNLKFRKGDLMVIEDHIDLFMPDPTAGEYLDFGGNPVFQWQTSIYDPELGSLFLQAAMATQQIEHVHAGIYTARTGRTYEASAVSRALRQLGADAVGMSVIPEAIVAFNRGMRVLGTSIITNVVDEQGNNPTSHGEVTGTLGDIVVLERLATVYPKFFQLFNERNPT